jgi:regulatory protein
VARYAVTRQRLARYLERMVAHEGWDPADGAGEAACARIVDQLVALGAVDDGAVARMIDGSARRQFQGPARLSARLAAAGVAPEIAAATVDEARAEPALAAAIGYAMRKRLGPFARTPALSPELQAKAQRRTVAALVRAGHGPREAWVVARATDPDALARLMDEAE